MRGEIFFLIGTELAITLPSIAFIILSIELEYWYYIPITILLSIMNTYFLMKAGFSDPGYVKSRVPGTVDLNGQSIELERCQTCDEFKPLRSHHCKVCNRCVECMDHHCPWVGNCVGRKNYNEFVYLLCGTSIESLFVVIVNFSVLFSHEKDRYWILSLCLVLILTSLSWSLLGFFAYHFYLISINQTTHENARRLFRSGNPYNRSCIYNCKSFFKRRITDAQEIVV